MILSIVIPTYNRYEELGRCLSSIAKALSIISLDKRKDIEILIGDNNSIKSTRELVLNFCHEINIVYVQRCKNIGLTKNVLDLTVKASGKYVMWLTDDDLILPSGIDYILKNLQEISDDVGFIWGQLPTFDVRTGSIFTIASKSFNEKTKNENGKAFASAHGSVGWALSRQIYKKTALDFDGVSEIDNAYFPIFLASRAMLNHSSVYLDEPYVLHAYHNKEYWEEWGDDELRRKLRIFCDALTILDIALLPHPHESEVIENISKYRRTEIKNYTSSSDFKLIVDREGLNSVLHQIKERLGNFIYIFKEIEVEISLRR